MLSGELCLRDLHFHEKSCEGHPDMKVTHRLVFQNPGDFILLCDSHHKKEHIVLDLVEQELADL